MTKAPRTLFPLPPRLREISQIIGREATFLLAATRGGTAFYVPADVPEDHWLAKIIGHELARKLAQHFSVQGKRGTKLNLPLLPKEFCIDDLLDERKPTSAIALKLGISQRTVFRYKKMRREAGGI